MDNLEIVIGKRYATEKNLTKIRRIAPDANISIYHIQKRHQLISKIRGGFRRYSPFNVYLFLPKKLDALADEQILVWIDPPINSPDGNTVLLFTPGIERNIAEELRSRLNPCWIHSITTGVDRLPSIPEATIVTSSRGLHSARISEFVMGTIFAFAKNLPEHISQKRKKVWNMLPSKMIKGARLGVVGFGSIGNEIAKIGKKCGMEVWATKRKLSSVDFVDRLIPSNELPCLLREVDYVVLAVPLTKDTHNLIGKAELDMMKNTASLINICRGAVVDEDALYYALKDKTIQAACIDVFKDEKPLPRYSRFYKLPNVLITSWSAWKSSDSADQQLNLFFNNLERFINGEPLLSIVDNSQLTHSKEI
jgi:phosphoglycerate dehydrogenase-like enzyme